VTVTSRSSVNQGEIKPTTRDGARARPRILYVWPYLEWGGVQIYFTGIIKHIRDRYDVCAVMPRGSDEKLNGYLERLGVQVDYFDAHVDQQPAAGYWQKIRRRIRNARCSFVLNRYLGRDRLHGTLVHADLAPWSEFVLLVLLCLRCSVVITLHIAIPELSWIRRLEWRLKFRVLCGLPGFHMLVSNMDMYESLRPFVSDKFMRSIEVAYTGIDVAEMTEVLSDGWDRAAVCRQYGLPEGRLLAFSLGQLIERKGCLTLLDAAGRLGNTSPYFVWIGDGNLYSEIDRQIESRGLRRSFRVIRPRDIGPERQDLLMLLRAADLFVHPSFSEGLPGALLEAMALGKPCIASSVNAIPEAIQDGVSGVLVRPGDPVGLANAIKTLDSDLTFREAIARAGQEIVFSRFTEKEAARVTACCYASCFAGYLVK
jgi:glycosyltransferase involved in cell wall biosynthesis